MEFRQLNYFVEAARHHNLTRAAEKLRVAQPALSQQIHNLETELGVKLFTRTGRGVALTEAGTVFLIGAEKTLAEAEKAKEATRSFMNEPTGKVTVGALESLVQTRLPQLLVKFGLEFPRIKVFIRENTTGPLLEALNKGDVDLALAHGKEEETGLIDRFQIPVGIMEKPLYQEELILAVPKKHRIEKHPTVSIKELRGEPFVAFKQGSGIRSLVMTACVKEGFEPSITYECASPRILVSEGLGVSVLPRLMAESPGPPVSIVPFFPNLSRAVSAYFFQGRYLSPAAKTFLQFVKKEIGTY